MRGGEVNLLEVLSVGPTTIGVMAESIVEPVGETVDDDASAKPEKMKGTSYVHEVLTSR